MSTLAPRHESRHAPSRLSSSGVCFTRNNGHIPTATSPLAAQLTYLSELVRSSAVMVGVESPMSAGHFGSVSQYSHNYRIDIVINVVIIAIIVSTFSTIGIVIFLFLLLLFFL